MKSKFETLKGPTSKGLVFTFSGLITYIKFHADLVFKC